MATMEKLKERPEAYLTLLDAMEKIFENPKYFDLTIKCGDRTWEVHKDVLCAQVCFIAKCCDGGWKDSEENNIELPDDHPAVVNAMLCYIYTVDYDEEDHGDSMSPLVFDAHVHTIADKYDIPGLGKLAKSRFDERAKEEWDTSGFAEAAALVFTDPAVPDDFRETVVAVATERAKELNEDDSSFRQTAQKIPALGAALWAKVVLAEEPKPKEKVYKCPHNYGNCHGQATTGMLQGQTRYRCQYCGNTSTVAAWLASWSKQEGQSTD